MGYRSQIAVAIKQEVYQNFLKGKNEGDNEKIISLIQSTDKMSNLHGDILLYWESIKWYPGYPDVDAFMLSLNSLNHEDYYFIELGEDVEDTTIQGSWWDNPFELTINRSINMCI